MNKTRRYGALSSSENPEVLAQKVKGAILLASSVIIFFASKVLGITLTAADITSLATQLGGVAGAIWMVHGVILNIVAVIAEKKSV